MFDGNSGDDGSSGLPGDKKFPQPPFLQRSVSAPAIAEHVSEAIIPAFKYDAEEELRLNLSYQFPSRMNPRLPQSKKTGSDEGESAYAHLFGESNQKTLTLLGDDNALPAGLISSLMSDQPRTPLDLIQADFPSTPSSIYSKHILRNNESRLEEDMQAAELKVASITEETSFINQTTTKNNKVVASTNGSIPPLIASPSTGEDSLDHTAKAFQTLYVSSSSDLNQLGAASASAPLLSQFHSNQTATGSFFSNGSPVPPAAATSVSSTTANNSSGTTGTTTTSGTGTIPLTMLNAVTNFPPVQETVLPFASAPSDARISLSATTSNNLPVYSGILGGPPSVAGNQTVATSAPATVATSVASVTPPILTTPQMNNHHNAGTGPSMAQQPTAINMMPPLSLHPSQQGGHFYIPQIYLAANGQPIYYRNVATGQFPEFMYAPNLVDQNGLQINSSPLIADPNQIHLQQQAQLGAYLTPFSLASISGGPVQTAYWPSSDPSLPQTMAYPSAMRMVAEDPSRAGLVYQTNMAPYPNALTSVHPLAIQSHLNRSMAPPPANPPGNAAYPLSVPTPVAGMPGMIPRSTGLSHPSPSLDQSTAEELGGGGGREGVGSSQSQSSSFRGGGGREHHSHNHHQNHHNNHNNNHHNHRSHVNQRGGGGQHHLSSSSLERGGGGSPVRDGLVEEFRSTFGKSRQWTLRDLSNHIVAFCQDQHGSRFIQQKLEICSDSDKQLVFDEIFPSAQTLMTDVFGNYVLQKLFEYGSVEQCESLASLLKGQAVQLSMQMYGCRVVQKALEYVTRERLVDLVSEFDNPQMLIRCVHDSNGNHVIQKCIEIVSKAAKEAESKEMMDFLSGKIQFIIDAFKGRVKELSSHPYGCRVVQRILEHCADNQKAVILEELRGSCGELVQDCYGNYVIQFVMQHGWEADRAVLIKEVQEHLLDYSQHKFASNVVEKCLQFASKRDRDEIIWTIINVTFDLNNPVDSKGHCVLESMVRDPYANYVVQKVIDVSDEKQRAAIMRYVKDNITQLRKYTYGKHIIVRLEKITNEKF